MNVMNPQSLVAQFQRKRHLRAWQNNHFGGFDAVKLHPLSMCRFRPDEGGTVSTALNVKLAPVSGYMRSSAYVHVQQVFVPYQAIEKIVFSTTPDAGVTEMAKRRLLAGQGIGLRTETDVSQACNVNPRSVGGQSLISITINAAYSAAVNHLRKLAYYGADQEGQATAILPAILTANILERFDGVLDPERLIDGAINLSGDVPLKIDGGPFANGIVLGTSVGPDGESVVETTTGDPFVAGLDGTSEVTLRDMIKSKKLDQMIRGFAKMVIDNPVDGEEAVERALYGISVDHDHHCRVLYDQVHEVRALHTRPTDGASINDISAHFELNTNFATLVPRSELGGQLVTLVSVKPLETVASQPDPAQTEPWALVNRVHDQLELDEVLLTRADLDSTVSAADEDQPVFWTGHGRLPHDYSTRGPNEAQIGGVEMKSSMWTYPIPASVTPENISYPAAGIDMYPFFNWNGHHAEYTVNQVATISTPLAKGPNPVERLQIFQDNPSLIDDDE